MNTLKILVKENDVEKVDVKEDNSFDHNFIVPLKPRKTYKVKVKIMTIEKHQPKIFFD
jgi:hypothetical protein